MKSQIMSVQLLITISIVLVHQTKSTFGRPASTTTVGVPVSISDCPQCSGYYDYDGTVIRKKNAVFMTKGWGAGGMPFNVLYNSKSYRSPDKYGVVRPAVPVALPLTDLTTVEQDQKLSTVFVTATSVDDSLSNNKNQQNRKHFSIIPQLFVSYGWGPLGK